MTQLRNLPIGIQNFESLRSDGYLYIDKTHLIYRLVTTGRYYFLSRPRRFGKSLLMSTIHSYFSGRKDLFDGLEYPVLHLDLNTQQYNAPEKLSYVINDFLLRHEDIYGIESDSNNFNFGPRFEKLIRTACEKTGRRVAILVDEYDKPMLQAIGNPELQDAFRATLKGFYTQAEYHTSEGRIDMVVKTPKFCYVMEFKLDGTAEEALAQIQDKNYTLPFEIEDQQIVRLGINFDSATRNIDKVLVG